MTIEECYVKMGANYQDVIKLRDDEPSGYYCLDGIFYLKARRKL